MIGVTKEKTLERLIQQWLKPRQMQALISPHWANLTGKIFDRLPHASQKHNVGTCETGSKDPIMARNRSVSRPENLPAMTRIGLATSIPALQLCSFPAFQHSSIPAFQQSCCRWESRANSNSNSNSNPKHSNPDWNSNAARNIKSHKTGNSIPRCRQTGRRS